MAFARSFGGPNQSQGTSPWTSGAPPGQQQQQMQMQQQQPGMQPMFSQPMGAFDISGAWQGGQHPVGGAQQQWVPGAPGQQMQQVQFVPNPTFMQQQAQMPIQQHHHHQQQMRQQRQLQHQQMQNQRSMHQRSLSAPRLGVNGLKRAMNQNNNSSYHAGQQQQQNNWNRQTKFQQSRMNNNNSNTNPNANRNNQKPSNQSNNNTPTGGNKQNNQQKQPQQQRSNQQLAKQETRKVKVTKNAKKQLIEKSIKLTNNNTNKQAKLAKQVNQSKPATDDMTDAPAENVSSEQETPAAAPSKTAVRKKLKLEARKNAESLTKSKLPVVKATKQVADTTTDIKPTVTADQKLADETIDQAQLKCVPAVFGFVCKICDVFLRDKLSRREHIDSDDHMEKFRVFEEEDVKRQQQEVKEEVNEEVKEELKEELKEEVKEEVKEELKEELKQETDDGDKEQQPSSEEAAVDVAPKLEVEATETKDNIENA